MSPISFPVGVVSSLFVIVPLFVFGVFAFVIGSMLYRWFVNQTSPVEERYATVMAKRTQVSGGGHDHHAHTSYYVTFQFDDGGRLELPVNGSDYGVLVEGDTGLLNWQGTRFNGFARHK